MIETDNWQLLDVMNKVSSDYLKRLIAAYKDMINTNQYAVLNEVLCCIENRCKADILYKYISDDDENSIAFFAENAESHVIQSFFQAILSVIACLTYSAYRSEGRKYLPEDIESIDEKKLDGFFELIRNNNTSAEECYEYFCRNVCV